MKKKNIISFLLLSVLFLASCSESPNREADNANIVSLSPNITEILFALGLGEQVVGVTSYCDYPPACSEK
ncbi:hypothetical protein [Sedimentisphaera cyanobacteriorum]|nr:hypothetical protein [Sedimentisphaera cyanobacteriorum]